MDPVYCSMAEDVLRSYFGISEKGGNDGTGNDGETDMEPYSVAGINAGPIELEGPMRFLTNLNKDSDREYLLYSFHVMIAVSNWGNLLSLIEDKGADMELVLGDGVLMKIIKGMAELHVSDGGEEAIKDISEGVMAFHAGQKKEYVPFVKRGLIEAVLYNHAHGKDVNALIAIYESLDRKCPFLEFLQHITA